MFPPISRAVSELPPPPMATWAAICRSLLLLLLSAQLLLAIAARSIPADTDDSAALQTAVQLHGGSGKCWTRASFQGTEGQGAALNNCQKRPAGWCSGGHLPGAHVYKMWRAGRCTPGFLVSMDTKSGGTWNALIAGYACTARTRPRGPCCIWTNGGAFLILANDVTVAFLMNACASTDQCLAEGQRAALNDCQKRSAGWCSGGHLPSGHVLKMW